NKNTLMDLNMSALSYIRWIDSFQTVEYLVFLRPVLPYLLLLLHHLDYVQRHIDQYQFLKLVTHHNDNLPNHHSLPTKFYNRPSKIHLVQIHVRESQFDEEFLQKNHVNKPLNLVLS